MKSKHRAALAAMTRVALTMRSASMSGISLSKHVSTAAVGM